MLSFDDRVAVKPANTNFPAGRTPRLLRSVRASARERHHNFSTARRNQYFNVNLRDLKKPADGKALKEPSPERQRKAREERTETLKWPAIEDPLLGKIECPLNSPDFPPVSEKDHLVGRCYCYLCSCAAHLCPGDRRARGAASRDSSPRQGRGSLGLASSQAVEFLTTRQRDFFTFTVTANFAKPKETHQSPHTARRHKPLTAPSAVRRDQVGSAHRTQSKGRQQSSKRAMPKPPAVVSRTLIAADTHFDTANRSIYAVNSSGEESPAKSPSKSRDSRPVTVSVRKRKGEWSPPVPPALKAATLKQFPGPPLRASVG